MIRQLLPDAAMRLRRFTIATPCRFSLRRFLPPFSAMARHAERTHAFVDA